MNETKAMVKFQLKKVLCMGVAVGNLGMEEKQVFQNVQLSVNFLVSLLKKNWQNVRAHSPLPFLSCLLLFFFSHPVTFPLSNSTHFLSHIVLFLPLSVYFSLYGNLPILHLSLAIYLNASLSMTPYFSMSLFESTLAFSSLSLVFLSWNYSYFSLSIIFTFLWLHSSTSVTTISPLYFSL